MPSEGVMVVAENHQPAPPPDHHRGYVRLTAEDLAEAGSGWLQVSTIGAGHHHCVIGHITHVASGSEQGSVLTFHRTTADGELLTGKVSSTAVTSFRPFLEGNPLHF